MKLLPAYFLFFSLLFLALSCSEGEKKNLKAYESLSKEEQRQSDYAVQGIDIAEGLQAHLFAAEPMLINPTNIDIDAKGRIWVCEAFNYRNQLNPNNPKRKAGDRIVILEDSNGDGQADKSKVFYQGPEINSALGICVLEDRVIVSVSPHVYVFKDTDGDDVADSKEIMFQGIGGEQHDHGVHSFTFGPDGKLYFNFGNEGKRLLDKNGKQVIDIHGYPVIANTKPFNQGMIFRCDLDGTNVEVLAYNFRNNYELAVDAFGTIWQSDNDDDGNQGTRINYVMEYGNYGFKNEITGAAWRAFRTGMNEEIPLKHWHLNDPGVVPNLLQTGAGSPTGIILYEGDLLPEAYHNSMIHCDAGPNVLRAYPTQKSGAGYSAKVQNLMKGIRDQWFRPSDVCVAPDGSLFIADWYDPGVGGHQMGDTAKGRIYRLAPRDHKYKTKKYDFTSIDGAIEALKNPNLHIRSRGWRKLHKEGAAAEASLRKLWTSKDPVLRARALWLLSKIEGKEAAYVEEAIQDQNSDIRITGIRAARQNGIALFPILEKLANDPSPQVRREVLIAMRFMKGSAAAELWADLALQAESNDRWYLEALGIGSDLDAEQRFAAWQSKVGDQWNQGAGKNIVWRTRAQAAQPLLARLILNSGSYREAERYFRAFDFHKGEQKNEVLLSLLKSKHKDEDQLDYLAISSMDPAFIKSKGKARRNLNRILKKEYDTENYLNMVRKLNLKNEGKRVYQMALTHVGSDLGNQATFLLKKFEMLGLFQADLSAKKGAEKLAVLKALGQAHDKQADDILKRVASQKNEHQQIRIEALNQLGNSWLGQKDLYELVKGSKLPEDLRQAGANRLLSVGRKSYRDFASDFLKIDEKNANLSPIAELVEKEGNSSNGKEVYATYCATCHVINGEGIDFGPNLSEIGDKLPKGALYSSIMNPSAGISFGYEGYLISKKDGNQLLGYKASETKKEIMLRMAGGNNQLIEKKDIKSIELMSESLMTPFLHVNMKEEELVDLIEYLASLKKQDMITLR
ncbi:MAG: c-type cytochrome [Bacteroidia bacterium]|nr:c-type cytochrome [Bacteroidia bacterium]